jgi:hypothetical protein
MFIRFYKKRRFPMRASTPQPATGNSQPATGYTCRHIHTLGHRCGSPCLRGQEFCYFHHTNHRPPLAPITDPELLFAGPHTILDVPSLEDRPAIQLALLELARRIGNNTIDPKRANSLLRVYHIASVNLACEERAAMRGRTIPKSERDLPANRLPQPIPITQATEIVQDVEFSPTLGPLAPILEYGLPESESDSEEEREPSLAQIIDAWIKSPPDPEPVPLEKRPYDFDTLQLLRRTLATTTNPETAARIRKALEEEALLPNHNLHIQACIDPTSESGTPDSTVSPSTLGILPPNPGAPGSTVSPSTLGILPPPSCHSETPHPIPGTAISGQNTPTPDNPPQNGAHHLFHRKVWNKRGFRNYRKPAL